jgi:hypothetical protein
MGIDPGIDPGLRAAWAVLGLAADADRDQVTRAYRRLARATHPDVSPSPDAAARFAAIGNAYRRAVEATRRHEQDPHRGEAELTVPRAPGSRQSATSSSTDGATWVHVSAPRVQTQPVNETPDLMLWSGPGGLPLGYPSRLGDAPIVAGPVHIQPPSDPNLPDRTAPAARSRTPDQTVWFHSETWPGGAG